MTDKEKLDKIAEYIPDEYAWAYVEKIVYGALGRK